MKLSFCPNIKSDASRKHWWGKAIYNWDLGIKASSPKTTWNLKIIQLHEKKNLSALGRRLQCVHWKSLYFLEAELSWALFSLLFGASDGLYLTNDRTIHVPGFWSGFDLKQEAEGSGPSPFMLQDEQAHPALRGLTCCWDQEVSQTWQGTCHVTPPPCCHHSSAEEPRQEHLHIPHNPCLTFTRLGWVSGCFPVSFQHRELEATKLPSRT